MMVTLQGWWEAGELRSKAFRHTYTATRLQTLDRGAPVSVFTVSRELGHASTAMVERVYAHLGETRHRRDVVEYRIEPFADMLGERLTTLQASENVTTELARRSEHGSRCRS
ncbi:MAG TPA: hypothetical protein VH137_08315 [Gemmatimonadales bacterium]|jgi:integrase|nr:hypothetical protein [Gemmatimonadales bacterium]